MHEILHVALFKKSAKPLHPYVGTNDIDSDKTDESIANTIIDLATSLKNDQLYVSISNMILRTDHTNLNEKECLANGF